MRRAMAEAEVGDDLFGDDPTVNRLQDRVTELTGKQAALYLPTGTLCNEIAMHAFTLPGQLVVCEENAHTGQHEAASAALLSGIVFRRLHAESRGLITADQVAAALSPGDPYDSGMVGLVCAEHDVPLYLDGARIFNACAVTGATVADYAAQADALMFCLSKGLGAPVGSVLAGDSEFIAEARRLKVLLGAGWRQAGVLAAAGLIALDEGPGRLHEDHANARRLADGMAEVLPGSVDPEAVPTNIVFVDVSGTGHSLARWVTALATQGLLVTTVAGKVRMLTHRDITAGDVDAALAAWRKAIEDLAALQSSQA